MNKMRTIALPGVVAIVVAFFLWSKGEHLQSVTTLVGMTNPASPTVQENSQPQPSLPPSPDNSSNVAQTPVPGQSRLLSTNAEAYEAEATRQFLEQFNKPINFYGKVLDENNQPISGVNVHFEWNKVDVTNLSPTNQFETGSADTKSDAAGLFSLEGQRSDGLNVKTDKPDYYNVFSSNTYSFNYASSSPFVPDSQNPVVFRLKKKGVAEPLLTGEKLFGFKPDGTQYYINLLTGNKATVRPDDWDISVRFTRSRPNGDRKFDWSVALDTSGGGLIETNGQFAFIAPEIGYNPITVTENAADPSWQGGWKAQLFVQSRAGKIYSRLEATIVPDYSENAAIDMKYFVNPAGSRNLEFDPSKAIQP